MYAGNIIATVQLKDAVKVLTVRPTTFDKSAASGGSATVTAVSSDGAADANETQFVAAAVKKSDRPELATAKVVVAGGRALKDAETFKSVLEPLATKLNAAIGASRAAVDANFCSYDMQVGQTGKVSRCLFVRVISQRIRNVLNTTYLNLPPKRLLRLNCTLLSALAAPFNI
jgi:electron transfer flavoprotein alpha subunit